MLTHALFLVMFSRLNSLNLTFDPLLTELCCKHFTSLFITGAPPCVCPANSVVVKRLQSKLHIQRSLDTTGYLQTIQQGDDKMPRNELIRTNNQDH